MDEADEEDAPEVVEVEAEADTVRVVVVGEATGVDSSIAVAADDEEVAATGADAELLRAGL